MDKKEILKSFNENNFRFKSHEMSILFFFLLLFFYPRLQTNGTKKSINQLINKMITNFIKYDNPQQTKKSLMESKIV